MAKRLTTKKQKTYLPAVPDVIKVIAMQGYTDDELAMMFGLDPRVVNGWRKMYPSFDKAIEEGRSLADLQVIEALHKKAVGYSYKDEVVIRARGKSTIAKVKRRVEPETNAIKFWLSNRDPERWSDRTHHQVTGKKGEPPVQAGVKSETKMELISSILSLIQPKPDGA